MDDRRHRILVAAGKRFRYYGAKKTTIIAGASASTLIAASSGDILIGGTTVSQTAHFLNIAAVTLNSRCASGPASTTTSCTNSSGG